MTIVRQNVCGVGTVILLVSVFLLAGCNLPGQFAPQSATPTAVPVPAAEATVDTVDLLARVEERGYLKVGVRIWPDNTLNPPLFRNVFGALDGYEVDLAWALAEGLGTELEMSAIDPRLVAQGGWSEEWDLVLAWVTPSDQARQHLLFSDPYAYDQGGLLWSGDEPSIRALSDLEGRRVAVPSPSAYESWLSGSLTFEQAALNLTKPSTLELQPYPHDGLAIDDLLGAPPETAPEVVLHSTLVLETALTDTLPLQMQPVDGLVWPVAVAFDRYGLPSDRLRLAVNETLAELRFLGALPEMSISWYGRDVTRPPE